MLNGQLGVMKDVQQRLEMAVREEEEHSKKVERDFKKKMEETGLANEKRTRDMVVAYEKEADRRKKEADSLYSVAVLRH